jgi:glycosyltransferase involved in cell wall biosynthesis
MRVRLAERWMRFWWPTVEVGEFAGCNVVAHEWLTSAAGSDKVAAELVEVSAAVALLCLSARPEVIEELGIVVPVHQSRVGRWAESGTRWHLVLPLMPLIWGSLRLSEVGTLVTSSHSLVNSIPEAGRRVCYCHTPVRYGWEWRMELGRSPRWLRPLMRPGAAALRRWDRRIARRVDVFVANSAFVAGRILAAYGRSATVVHPPIDLDRFQLSDAPRGDGFVVAGRLVAYKRADVAVRAATRANVALVVAGSGPELAALRAVAGPTVHFVESPSDDQLIELMQRARAVLHPGIEDFGMILVEAQACGTPVMARAEGGALETVDPTVSGVLVGSDRVDDWAAAMTSFSDPGSPSARRAWASTFSVEVFRRRMHEVLDMSSR